MNPYEVRLDEMVAAQECLLNAAHRCGRLQARLRRTPVSRNPRLLQFVEEGSTPITPFHVSSDVREITLLFARRHPRLSLNAKSLDRLT
jgi:hypothetical protein